MRLPIEIENMIAEYAFQLKYANVLEELNRHMVWCDMCCDQLSPYGVEIIDEYMICHHCLGPNYPSAI